MILQPGRTCAAGWSPDRGLQPPVYRLKVLDVSPAGSRPTVRAISDSAIHRLLRGCDHQPLCALVDHGPASTGEPLAVLRRPGQRWVRATTPPPTTHHRPWAALTPLSGIAPGRPGRRVLVRMDDAGATHQSWLAGPAVSGLLGRVRPTGRAARTGPVYKPHPMRLNYLAASPIHAALPKAELRGVAHAGRGLRRRRHGRHRSSWGPCQRAAIRRCAGTCGWET